MTISQEMLRAARRATKLLADPAATARYFASRQLDHGGFADRAGKSDLYYSVFGLLGMRALGDDAPAPPGEAVRWAARADKAAAYLRSFAAGDGLDMLHLACLARCWASLPRDSAEAPPAGLRRGVLERLGRCRTDDGGWALRPGEPFGSAYGCFVALGALQDVGAAPTDAERASVARCLAGLRLPNGSYANGRNLPVGSAPATAAAATVLCHLGLPVPEGTAGWLAAQHRAGGGFAAIPLAPQPDLLSTATAVHALRLMGADLEAIAEPCLRFVQSLHRGGGFAGHTGDPTADCEYTFYALLALGDLAAPGRAAGD